MSDKKLKREAWVSILFTVVMTVISLSAFADGGANGGGGDIERSNPVAVEAAFRYALSDMRGELTVFGGDRPDHTKNSKLKDARVEEMYKKMSAILGVGATRHFDNLEERIYLKPKGPCTEEPGHRSGSAAIGDLSKKICISVEELSALPKHRVTEQFFGLLGHELAHMCGYNEEDAKYLQGYLLKMQRNRDAKIRMGVTLGQAQDELKEVSGLVQRNASQAEICPRLGRIEGKLEAMASMTSTFREYGDLSELDQNQQAVQDIENLLAKLEKPDLMTYCGLPPAVTQLPRKEIHQGDNQVLMETTTDLKSTVDEILYQTSPAL